MKVIDLLNKIANGEETPNKIRFDNKEWNRVCGEKNVYYIDDTDDDLFVYFFRRNITFTLNDEVEIIEEPLEIGMYVRTINGKIWVITSQRAISGHRKDIINASYNIIDLIEVGDYVNGVEVVGFEKDNDNKEYLQCGVGNYVVCTYYAESIKSIPTKEQFESMEYKIC